MSKLTGKVAVVTGAPKASAPPSPKPWPPRAPPSSSTTPPARPARTPWSPPSPGGGKAVAVSGDVSKAASAGHHRRGSQDIRPPRHPGQQLGRLRVRAARRRHRRALPQAVQRQRAGPAAGHPGRGEALGEGGSIINIGSGVSRSRRRQRRLHRHQGRGGCHHRRARHGTRPAQDPRQLRSIRAWSKPKAHTPPASSARTSRSSSSRRRRSAASASLDDIASVAVFLASDDSALAHRRNLMPAAACANRKRRNRLLPWEPIHRRTGSRRHAGPQPLSPINRLLHSRVETRRGSKRVRT